VIDDQIGRVAFQAAACADLDRSAVFRAQEREEIEQDTVLAVLRVAAKLDIRQRGQRRSGRTQLQVFRRSATCVACAVAGVLCAAMSRSTCACPFPGSRS
jgi:hypothetical protein